MPTVDVGDLGMTLRAGTPPVQDGRYGETANKAVSTAEIFVDRWQRSMVAMRDESEKFLESRKASRMKYSCKSYSE